VRRMVVLAVAVVLAAAAGIAGGYWLAQRNLLDSSPAARQASDSHAQHAAAPANTAAGAPAQERKVLYYRNPMGLPDTSPVPKKDAMAMDYVPVYADEAEAAGSGMVKISPERVQMIGVKSEPVGRRDLVRPIRAVGTVQFDERRTFVVSTRFEGWIEKLLVNATGETVRRGQPLMQVYSPDLVLAQQEYALLSKSVRADGGVDGEGAATRRLLEGAEQRLRYLDFPALEMERLKREAEPRSIITMPSPVAGTVIEKPALQGMRFTAGEPLYKIVDMSQVWLIAEVFEQDLAHVRVGQEAGITLRAYAGRTFKGRASFIYPTVGEATRTAKVRIEIPNPAGELKADMYATLEIASPLGPRNVLAVPESAVLDNGVRQVVLVDHGEGRFEPRTVKLGAPADGYVEVIEGVREGEPVVVSANFLIDAESNLKAALSGFGGGGDHQHQ
jgi:multidrug efflux pump subunit AcrA (membrane-fusion protein)